MNAAFDAAAAARKVGFVLLSSPQRPIPSTRVAVLNALPLLGPAGWRAEVLHAPVEPTETPSLDALSADAIAAAGFDVVVFQKVRGASVERLAAELARRGVRTVYLVCDIVDPRLAACVDATIVVTEFLRAQYPAELRGRVHVVHDGIEQPQHVVRWRGAAASAGGGATRPLGAVLVTSARMMRLPVLGAPPPGVHVRVVGRYPAGAGLGRRLRETQWHVRHAGSAAAALDTLRFAASARVSTVPWTPEGVYAELVAADVGILPIERPASSDGRAPDWKVKSENRLTLKMAVGLPVVATPIPAYEEALEHGVNGFFAENRGQWLEALRRLRDPALRERVGDAARRSVVERYSLQRQVDRLTAVLDALVADPAPTST